MLFIIIFTAILCLMSITDILLTNKTIRLLEENKDILGDKYKSKEDLECNSLVKFFWKKIGMEKTKILFLLFAPLIIIGLVFITYTFNKEYLQLTIGIFLGGYLIVNYIHTSNIDFINKEIKENEKYFKVETIKDTLHLNEKQTKKLEESIRRNEFETIYTCKKCNKELTGLINVRKHLKEKKHYSYKSSNGGTLCFA